MVNIARTLLVASFPLLCPTLPPPLVWPDFTAILCNPSIPTATLQAFELFTAERRAMEREQPRPEQGGQHISKEWLYSLKSRDCLWCFRCAYLCFYQ